MSFFVGYPGYREDRGFDPNPYGWMLWAIEKLADEPGGHVFLIGRDRAADSGVLVAYFPVRRFNAMAAGIEVEPGNSFPFEQHLPIPLSVLDELPRLEEGERRLLLPIGDDIGQELLKITQKHLATTDSAVSLGKGRTARPKREKSPAEQAEAIERDARSKGRIGQAAFRESLLDAYRKCPITGCALDPALSAAHIWEHHQGGGFEPWNGILLRADIHLLFDRHLLRIFPGDPPVVVLDERIREAAGYDFNLATLEVSDEVDKALLNKLLRERWDAANQASVLNPDIRRFPDPPAPNRSSKA